MKNEIIYSKQDLERVTRLMDHFLDYRDEFLYATLFKGCRKGYVSGTEYESKKKYRKKTTLRAVLHIFVTWVIAFLLKMILFPVGPDAAIYDAGITGVVCLIIYLGFLCPRAVLLHDPKYVNDDWRHRCFPMWEEREDHHYHLLNRPVFYGPFAIRAKRQVQISLAYRLERDMYEYAYDLDMLRCLCTVSEEIKRFAERCGEEYTKIDFIESETLTKADSQEGGYKIFLTEMAASAEDTVIPVETDVQTKTIELPYAAGVALKTKYQENKCLDLSVLDASFPEIIEKFNKVKKEIRIRTKDLELEEEAVLLLEKHD